MNSYTLSELTQQIEAVIKSEFTDPVWVRAEISELRESRGHCYIELIEKDESGDLPIAKTRATIWANQYRMLRAYFESSTGESLRPGLLVLVAVTVEFSGLYGFSLNIRDIDPVYTIGELAARRQEIIRHLEADGVINMNKELSFPELPQRIAIISSPTAAGYDDFCNQLDNNHYGYIFYKKLFPAQMQGAGTEASVITALEAIYRHINLFDLVIIIRGGGATTDLAAFDSYEMALNMAQFPLPVIAGIGHQRDQTIVDLVAHTSVKTPTAAAELLIHALRRNEERVDVLTQAISSLVLQQSRTASHALEIKKQQLKLSSTSALTASKNHLIKMLYRLQNIRTKLFQQEQNRLDKIESQTLSHSPKRILELGYSITTSSGKRIVSALEIHPNDEIETHFADGCVSSRVLSKKKKIPELRQHIFTN